MAETPSRTADDAVPPFVESLASTMSSMRSARDRAFPTSRIFGEPAWDILLALKAAEGSSIEATVKSIAENGRCALTTAQRWLTELERMGLVQRREGRSDRRKTCVSLTPQGDRVMDEALGAMMKVVNRFRQHGRRHERDA